MSGVGGAVTQTPGHASLNSSLMSSTLTVTVFTVTVNTGIVESMPSVTPDTQSSAPTSEEWTVDELARRAGLPVRTIREYQTVGLLPPPRRSGRIGLYDASHLHRLHLIARLQHRGYSLAGIGDLLAAWRSGDAISDVLGLEADQLVHVDEPGAPATLDQLTKLLPALVPDRLDDLLATGVVERCGPDRYCVPSPSLLQLTIDAITAGLEPDAVLTLLAHLRTAADTASDALLDALRPHARRHRPGNHRLPRRSRSWPHRPRHRPPHPAPSRPRRRRPRPRNQHRARRSHPQPTATAPQAPHEVDDRDGDLARSPPAAHRRQGLRPG